MKKFWAVGALCLLLVAGGTAAWSIWRQPEITPAMRGKETARRMGCFGCHGPAGVQGIGDPTAPSGKVPGWDPGTAAMYVTSEQDIREWILYGTPHRDSTGHIHTQSENLVPMPAYEGSLSNRELGDLVAYFRAASGFVLDSPDFAYEGWKIASRLGCFGCHGPSGMGGVCNPGSFTGYIPSWDGDEFKKLVQNDQELCEWILEGKTRRLWENPIGRHFLQRQKIQMPAYREHVSDGELNKLVAYIGWLRSR